jgi:hypothetical protein
MRIGLGDRRYTMPAETRKFGGKIYKYLVIGNKSETQGDKKRWEARGFSVRIVKWHGKYAVYTRK